MTEKGFDDSAQCGRHYRKNTYNPEFGKVLGTIKESTTGDQEQDPAGVGAKLFAGGKTRLLSHRNQDAPHEKWHETERYHANASRDHGDEGGEDTDRKSTRLNSSHLGISYA